MLNKKDKKTYNKAYYVQNKEYYKLHGVISHKKATLRNKAILLEIKKKGCLDCGYKDLPEILEFHHRTPRPLTNSLAIGRIKSCSIKSLLEKINKCDILCPTCHTIRHYLINKLNYSPAPCRAD